MALENHAWDAMLVFSQPSYGALNSLKKDSFCNNNLFLHVNTIKGSTNNIKSKFSWWYQNFNYFIDYDGALTSNLGFIWYDFTLKDSDVVILKGLLETYSLVLLQNILTQVE